MPEGYSHIDKPDFALVVVNGTITDDSVGGRIRAADAATLSVYVPGGGGAGVWRPGDAESPTPVT